MNEEKNYGTDSRLPLPFTGGARGGHLASYRSTNTCPPLIPPVNGRETSSVHSDQQTGIIDETELKTLDDKIKQAKKKDIYRQANFSDADSSKNKKVSGLQFGLELVAGVGVGGFLGFQLDKYLETQPFLFIVCLIFGFMGGFWNIVKQSRNV